MDFTVDYRISPNYHDYLEVAYVYGGKGTLKVGINMWEIEEGDLIILGTTEMHTFIIDYSTDVYSKRTRDIDRLKEVFSYVQTNYARDISLAKVAEKASMSTHYFCRFFKRVTGHTFIEYLQHIRIDVAKQLLIQDKLSNTQIAYEVGFNNLSYFYRIFKKYTRVNPTEFIRRINSNPEAPAIVASHE